MDLIAYIDAVAQRFPRRVAHRSAQRTLDYEALRIGSDRVAAFLSAQNDSSPVAVTGDKEPELLLAFLGAMKAGRPYVPIGADVPPVRVQQIIAIAAIDVVLTPQVIDGIVRREGSVFTAGRERAETETAYIMFTSGSSGQPKGVPIPLEGLSLYFRGVLHMMASGRPLQDETVVNQTPFSFDFSLMDIYLALTTGGTLVSLTREELSNHAALYAGLARSDATVLIGTPSFLRLCMLDRSFGPATMPRLATICLSGESLPPVLARAVFERFPQVELWNLYGPTEATVTATMVAVTPSLVERFQDIPIGRALPGVYVGVHDPTTGAPLGDGERGEIVIAGPVVSPGYLARPDLSDSVFFLQDGVRAYRTGDWGTTRDGLFFYEGRMHGMVKLGGNRLELEDIEVNLRKLDGVLDAIVVLELGPPAHLLGFVVAPEASRRDDFELSNRYRELLAQRVPPYMVPQRLIFIDDVPMTATGKLDREKLAQFLR